MTFCELTMSEMDSWLFIQVRKKNGDLTPPPQYALPAHLWFAASATCEHGCAGIKLFENPSLHGFAPHFDEVFKCNW